MASDYSLNFEVEDLNRINKLLIDKILQQVFLNILDRMSSYHRIKLHILLDIILFKFHKIFIQANVKDVLMWSLFIFSLSNELLINLKEPFNFKSRISYFKLNL